MKSNSELLNQLLNTTTDELYVQTPATITDVSADGNYVNAILHINDDEPDLEVFHIRVQRPETQRAYIYLGIKKGDKGIVRFFDRSVEGYLKSDYDYNSDDRQHDINDRCFELGFLPNKEAYIYPINADIEIGLKNNTVKMTFTNGQITIIGNVIHNGNLTVNGTITATGEIIGNSIPLSAHKHLGVTTGQGTSGLPTT